MHDRNLSGIDDTLSVKSHRVDGLDILAETFHVVQIRVDSVKTLFACSACRNDHVLACAHELDACAGDRGLKVLGVVAAGKSDTKQTGRSLADLESVQYALGRLKSRHDQRASFFDAKFLFSCDNGSFNSLDIFCGLGLGNTDRVAAACYGAADVFFPEIGVKTINTYNALYAAVIDFLQRVVERITGGIFLALRYRVLKIQHDRIGSVYIGILDQAGFLAIQEHHAPAKSFQVWIHLMAPPQGKPPLMSLLR